MKSTAPLPGWRTGLEGKAAFSPREQPQNSRYLKTLKGAGWCINAVIIPIGMPMSNA